MGMPASLGRFIRARRFRLWGLQLVLPFWGLDLKCGSGTGEGHSIGPDLNV